MTTLDDLTPLQRQELIGTWVDLNGSTQPHIYLGEFTSNTGIRHGARLLNPTYTDTHAAFEGCTPRPDLPRAWNPDGTPVVMDVQTADYRPGAGRGFYTIHETTEKGPELPEGTTHAQRWVGEWEEITNA